MPNLFWWILGGVIGGVVLVYVVGLINWVMADHGRRLDKRGRLRSR